MSGLLKDKKKKKKSLSEKALEWFLGYERKKKKSTSPKSGYRNINKQLKKIEGEY